MEFTGGKKYGLHLRAPVAAQSKKPVKKPVALPSVFGEDDEDTVEEEQLRQALKKRSVREAEEQQKRALEEDPNVFDYDAVYDSMKDQQVRPILQDRAQRESKYIGKLVEKAKARAQEQEIVREKILLKERMKEDDLYRDKEKFVTSAYKKKLAEQAKWVEEERRRELRDQAEEVTKKSDLSDFYRNLMGKNVAFGAGRSESGEKVPTPSEAERLEAGKTRAGVGAESADRAPSPSPSRPVEENTEQGGPEKREDAAAGTELKIERASVADDAASEGEKVVAKDGASVANTEQKPPQEMNRDSQILSARERYLARKRQRES